MVRVGTAVAAPGASGDPDDVVVTADPDDPPGAADDDVALADSPPLLQAARTLDAAAADSPRSPRRRIASRRPNMPSAWSSAISSAMYWVNSAMPHSLSPLRECLHGWGVTRTHHGARAPPVGGAVAVS
jgi:hypothetical protein